MHITTAIEENTYMNTTSNITLSNLRYSQKVFISRSTSNRAIWTSKVERYLVKDNFILEHCQILVNFYFWIIWQQDQSHWIWSNIHHQDLDLLIFNTVIIEKLKFCNFLVLFWPASGSGSANFFSFLLFFLTLKTTSDG